MNLQLLDLYDRLLTELELTIVKKAKGHDVRSFYLLRSIPGMGKILILLYEIHDIDRFPRTPRVRREKVRWAFSEAACLFLRGNEQAQLYHDRLVSKHGAFHPCT